MSEERKMSCEDCGFAMCRCDTANEYTGFDPLMRCGDSMTLRTLKRCYRKHVQDDYSIGWEELSDELGNALAQIMGDDEFQHWLNTK